MHEVSKQVFYLLKESTNSKELDLIGPHFVQNAKNDWHIHLLSCLSLTYFSESLLLYIAPKCIILLHMGLQLQRLLFLHQLLFKKVVLKTSDAIYYFRVKNG